MGQMHVIRSLAAEHPPVEVVGTDVDAARLVAIEAKARPVAERVGVPLRFVDTRTEALEGTFTYTTILAPSGALVAAAILTSADGGLIDVFAGIPVGTRHDLDLDEYIARRCYMFGTSGSNIADMKAVLEMVAGGRLDTNVSVDAICGMAGALDGLAAVERQTMAGKIIIYPHLHDLGLTPLRGLDDVRADVAEALDQGAWCAAAERALLLESDSREGRA
jgi:D-arabinose 1-dehydrogenase-like Zn-dependent alcohol dehydrogenase